MPTPTRRGPRAAGVLALAVLVAASGCVATVDVESQVTAAGTVEEYEVELTMPAEALEALRLAAAANGTTVEKRIASGYDESEYGSVDVDVTTRRVDGEERGVIGITLTAFDPGDVEGSGFDPRALVGGGLDRAPRGRDPAVSVTVEDNRVVYEDRSFYNASAANVSADLGVDVRAFELTYTVEMPGRIIDNGTNADDVDGDEATWERSGTDVFEDTRIRAVSERPDAGSGGGILGLPGPGTGVALLAVVLAAGTLAAFRRRD